MNWKGADVRGGYRIPIAGFLWAIAFAGAWFGALVSGSAFSVSVATMLALGTILTSVLGAALLRNPSKSFCLGFAVFATGFSLEARNDWTRGGLRKGLNQATVAILFHVPNVQTGDVRVRRLMRMVSMSLSLAAGLFGGLIACAAAGRPTTTLVPEPPIKDRPA